jgi:hypothetical protein
LLRLFTNPDWASPRAVGLSSSLSLPDYSIVVVKALVGFICTGEATLPSTSMQEFASLSILIGTSYIAEQVTDLSVLPIRLYYGPVCIGCLYYLTLTQVCRTPVHTAEDEVLLVEGQPEDIEVNETNIENV